VFLERTLIMRARTVAVIVCSLACALLGQAPLAQERAAQGPTGAANLERDYPVAPVPFTSVHLDDTFWAPKIETNRTATIPAAFEQCELTGRVDNFIRAATALRGEPLANTKPPGYPFDDSDLYKVIEGASYALAVHPDPALDTYVDGLIAKIAAAQEKDGYLYTTRTINPGAPHPWAGTERWQLEKVDSHELYDLGHLFEAATAHYLATGKRNFLDVGVRAADLLVETFGPGKRAIWPGHEITEMGLVRMYRVTGNVQYLNLAKFMLDVRKPDSPGRRDPAYNQSQVPVIEQTEAVGHAVRAAYMYSGMADVAALTGDAAYLRAIDAIWQDVVGKKLYVTGGIGALGSGEAFGKAYELPNMSAYCETCAAVGNDFWNERLFLLHADAKYVDVMERTLYNGLISGVSLDGKTFFYPNPLESKGQHERKPWFGVACCPGNITRFMASVPGYVYARQGQTIFVNLFAGGSADITLGDGSTVKLVQATRYPWDGHVALSVTPHARGPFTIDVRIPGWAQNAPVPGDLYRFLDRVTAPVVLTVNGRPVDLKIDKGYVGLTRTWHAGDVIDLTLPMPVRRVVANDLVEADKGRVALERGPLVYAAEWPDNPQGHVRNLLLPDTARLSAEFRPTLLSGVEVVTGSAVALAYDQGGALVKTPQPFVAIPYYVWANRGAGEMAVWIARVEASATPRAFPTLAMSSTVTTSRKSHLSEKMVNDGEEPRRSNESGSSFDWWPTNGTTEWLQYDFPKVSAVSEVQVYWFDDTGRGGVRVPASWRVLYRDGNTWRPVEATGPYGVDRDRYNVVSFKSVTTSALRLEVTMQKDFSAGVQEWKVK
jgi:DUF1680 family protein